MTRYIVEKVARGEYKILDTTLNLPIAWIKGKADADQACQRINDHYQKNLTKKS